MKEITLTEEEISSIKTSIEEKELIDDSEFEILKKWRSELFNSINFSKLFLKSYSLIKENLYLFEDEELKKKGEDIKELLDELTFVPELKNYLEIYGDGTEWGSYHLGQRIIGTVRDKNKEMESVISLFFMIFGESD